MNSHARSLVLLTCLSVAITAGAQNQAAPSPNTTFLVSVAFKPAGNPFGSSPPESGSEPAATAADPLFGAANVWNNLPSVYGDGLDVNPTWNNLVDSTGSSTGVSFSITGTMLPVELFPFLTNPDPLRSAFLAWNSWTNGGGGAGPGESTTISWTLTGLPRASTFDICVYGSVADMNRSFDMTIQGTTMSVPTFDNLSSPPPNCVLFSNVVSDAHGTISGVGAGVGSSLTATNEANWSGFQIVMVTRGLAGAHRGFVQVPH